MTRLINFIITAFMFVIFLVLGNYIDNVITLYINEVITKLFINIIIFIPSFLFVFIFCDYWLYILFILLKSIIMCLYTYLFASRCLLLINIFLMSYFHFIHFYYKHWYIWFIISGTGFSCILFLYKRWFICIRIPNTILNCILIFLLAFILFIYINIEWYLLIDRLVGISNFYWWFSFIINSNKLC